MTLEQRLVDLAARIREEVRLVRREATHGLAQCPVGWGIDADNILNTGAVSQSSGLSGVLRCVPLEIGPMVHTFDALAVNVTTAEAGGANVSHRAGLYRSNPEGSLPDTNGGLLGECAFTLTSTGQKMVQFVTPLTLSPGRYWLGWYNFWTTAPSTFAGLSSITNGLNLPRPTNLHSNSGSRYLNATGFSGAAMPNATPSPNWNSGGDSLVAHILMRRSA